MRIKKFEDFLQNLTIVFPLYNEEERIMASVRKMKKFFNEVVFPPKLIFVLDGCTDNTSHKLRETLKNHNLLSFSQIIEYQPNQGIGYAMHRGLSEVKTAFVLFSDFDLSTPLSELKKFYKFLPEYDIVIASRWLAESKVKENLVRKTLSFLSIILVKAILNINISDTQCGFKLFKTEVAKQIYGKRQINRFGVDFEILFIAIKMGFQIKEVPVEWEYAKGSKVRFLDYFKTFKELLKVRSNYIRGLYS